MDSVGRRKGRLRAPFRGVTILVCAALVFAVAVDAGKKKPPRPEPPDDLPQTYQEWLEEVDVLITDEERELFLGLNKDYQRDAFIAAFWQQRDPYADTTRNELLERWEIRVATARQRFEDLQDARARYLLLNGLPDQEHEIDCRGYSHPVEVWLYELSLRVLTRHPVIFYRPAGLRPWRRWDPSEGAGVFFDGQIRDSLSIMPGCDFMPLWGALRLIEEMNQADPWAYSKLIDRLEQPEPPSTPEWVSTFASYSTDLPPDAETFEAEVTFDFPGWRQSRTVAQGLIAVDAAVLDAAVLTEHRAAAFVLNGEVLDHDGALFESFRYRFDLPAEEIGERLPLVFQRYLRPGAYTVVLRLDDMGSDRSWRRELALEVPRLDAAAMPRFGGAPLDRMLAAANRQLAAGEASVEILMPHRDLLSGLVRFDVLVLGDVVDHVRFWLDGRPIFTRRAPPYSVELDFGELPRRLVLRATAHDASGRQIASDEELLNASPHRFAVRLVDPAAGVDYEDAVRVRVDVQVPEGEVLDRVEIYRGDERVVTLYEAPFVQPLLLPGGEEMVLVRAVGHLEGGTSAEDVVLVNGPPLGEEIGIDFVELYTSVVDRDRRPVLGLERDAFRVWEDGREQELRRFERVADLPIHATVLLDVSASMEERLGLARRAARELFRSTVESGGDDRIAAITFNDHPQVAVPFTADFDRFAAGLAGLRAERGTALYDSLIYALYYSTGLRGQRAILLLSDGVDESSRFTYEQMLDYARRSEVTVYAVALDLLGREHREARKHLRRLTRETGGRSFFLADVAELAAAYDAIREELRSKYLLAYQSDNTVDNGFRKVEVEVAGRGLEAKTIRGYYP